MKIPVVVVYHVPAERPEVWETFKPFVQRFADSMRKFDPGCDHKLVLAVSTGTRLVDDVQKDLEPVFKGMTTGLWDYTGGGMDIGAFQDVAGHYPELCFQVNCVSRVYAHQEGWLKNLVDARRDNGHGLYGTSAAIEQGRLHCCTRCYAFDSKDFTKYPWTIDTREKGPFFEWGDGNLLNWFVSQGLCARVVYWSGACLINEAGHWALPDNIFRKGDQSNMLVFDKHTDIYRDADEEEKKRLAAFCFPP